MIHVLRVIANFMVAGALLGIIFISWVGPKYLTWYNSPGAAGAMAMCPCAETTAQVSSQLLRYQMQGGAGGAGVGLVAGAVFLWRRRKSGAATVTPAPPPAQ